MSNGYTDVDRLILERWSDVRGLFSAYQELQGRIEETIDGVASRLERWLGERGYDSSCDAKAASIVFGKRDWHHRRKNDWLVSFEVGSFAPLGYRKVRDTHPFLWFYTQNLEFVRLKDADRAAFAKALRQELGDAAGQWADDAVDDAESPLGRYLPNISDKDRIDFVAEPEKMFAFLKQSCEELMVLAEPIDRVLSRFTSGATEGRGKTT